MYKYSVFYINYFKYFLTSVFLKFFIFVVIACFWQNQQNMHSYYPVSCLAFMQKIAYELNVKSSNFQHLHYSLEHTISLTLCKKYKTRNSLYAQSMFVI